MLRDARPGYSMCFFVETTVEGPLAQDRFTDCVRALVTRHPRLGSRIRNRLGTVGWAAPDRVPIVDWLRCQTGDPATAVPIDTSINLRVTSGVRFIVVETAPELWRVIMQVHHAVCDGVAALEALGDLWSLYHGSPLPNIRAGKSPPLPSSSPPSSVAMGEAAAAWWRAIRDFLTISPAVVAPIDPPTMIPQAEAWPPYSTISLSPERTSRLRHAAEARSATLNDVVVAATMRAIVAWNAEAGAPNRPIRINMPTNLRAPGSRKPAANEMSYAFLDRTPAACSSYEDLVESLASTSRWIQVNRATQQFLDTLSLCCRIPGLMAVITRLPLCFSTAVVSNVGNVVGRMRTTAPIRDGRICPADLEITRVTGVPPLRPLTRIAVGVTTYCGAMTVSVMSAPDVFAPAMREEFIERLHREIAVFADDTETR